MILSICQSNNIEVVPSIIQFFKSSFKKFKKIILDPEHFSGPFLRSVCYALLFSKDINEFEIGGNEFTNLWKYLGKFLNASPFTTKITIFNYSQSDFFDSYLEKLTLSNVSSITFRNVLFINEMNNEF